MPVFAPPLGAIVYLFPVEQRGRKRRSIGYSSGEVQRRGAKQHVSYRRMNAVGADDGIRERRCAIGKREANPFTRPSQTDELVAQLDAWVGNGARQSGVQIATMSQQIRRAEFLFG